MRIGTTVPFSVAVTDATGGNVKIQRKDYLPTGFLPVIDQGQEEVAGYVNDTSCAYSGKLPVVLFGDHTRTFKYVERPFALGADGVKVLVPQPGFSSKFLYYYFLSREIPSRGYSRHFKFLKEFQIPLFAPSEQSRIVELLNEADRLRDLRREADVKAARILPALFLKVFGDTATNPMGFRKKPLGELIKVKSGDFLPAKDMAPNGTFPVYGGNGVSGYHDNYMFEDRKVVLGRVGAYCGAVYYSEPKSWITDNALYVSEKLEPLNDYYLVSALEQANLNQYAGRAGQPLISGSRVYPVTILVPPENLQTGFSRSVASLLALSRVRSSASTRLDQVWHTLMSHAFSGQLTASWREIRMEELRAEMEEQARLLDLPLSKELDGVR
jgi:type I restriction enzyme S subunit